MKKIVLLLCWFGVTAVSFGNPVISQVKAPTEVGVFGLYEIAFQMNNYDNPYDPEVIDAYAEFVSPSGTLYRAIAFYYEAYTLMENKGVEVAARNGEDDSWKIRFTPNEVGRWTFTIRAVDRSGQVLLKEFKGKTFAFDCQAREAEGFIRKANARYLQRESFSDGRMQYHSYYPVGPNVAWYSVADYNKYLKPYGIYDYKRYCDLLSGNANYMRIWLNRYQYLALYGPEQTIRKNGKPVVYFDSSLNQKDAEELDFIVSYAAEHGIVLMPCFFAKSDFKDDSEGLEKSEKYGSMPSGWRYNPYHTILKLKRPVEFFSNPEAIRITGNFFRYIVARWGYATNIMAWEFFNEVGTLFKSEDLRGDEEEAILQWHQKMAQVVRSCDPHQHLLTTSYGSAGSMTNLPGKIYENLDVVQDHFYDNIQKAILSKQMPVKLLERSGYMRGLYPQKPCFMGEYGLNSSTSGFSYQTRDPKGVDMHNSTWASLFSGMMGPASFWYWTFLDQCGLFERFKPLTVFCKNLPVLSDNFRPVTNGVVTGSTIDYPDNLQMFYLINTAEDSIYGWCQDVAFAYQSLRRLTDDVGKNEHFTYDEVRDPRGYLYTLDSSVKPQAEFRSNIVHIPITNQSRGTRYQVRWYDTETGMEIPSAATVVVVRYRMFQGSSLSFNFPEMLKKGLNYTNTFGDAAFVLTKISD